MSQILNLDDNELDILAQFMGHDIRVHREYYRLPEATLQVAKVSKLLLLMESGRSGLSAGQTINDINDDEQEILTDSGSTEDSPEEEERSETVTLYQRTREVIQEERKQTIRKRQWKSEEKDAVMKHLGKYILNHKLPGKTAIETCIEKEPALKERSWRNIKDFCRNKITSMKK